MVLPLILAGLAIAGFSAWGGSAVYERYFDSPEVVINQPTGSVYATQPVNNPITDFLGFSAGKGVTAGSSLILVGILAYLLFKKGGGR